MFRVFAYRIFWGTRYLVENLTNGWILKMMGPNSKWLITMPSKSPKDRVVPLPIGHSLLVHAVYWPLTLPKTNSLPPKYDGFQVRNLLFQGGPYFQGRTVNFLGRVLNGIDPPSLSIGPSTPVRPSLHRRNSWSPPFHSTCFPRTP